MKKVDLRKEYKLRRSLLTDTEIDKLEQNIYHQVFELDYSEVTYIHIFLPIKRQKEINTYPIIDFLRSQGKVIVISKSNFSDNTLTHYIFDKTTSLEISKYGIPEPINAKELEIEKIDMVFVPLLISDYQNYRVGYGKGFYDRFLMSCRTDIKTVGLNFFEPVKKIEDIDKFDVALKKNIYPI